MKVTVYLTHRVGYSWPQAYINELGRKLNERGYHVSVISDDTPDEIARREINDSNFFVGVPNRFDAYNPPGTKRVVLYGAKKGSDGVTSSVQCAGCFDNCENVVDCLFQDELCMKEITPNDILEFMCLA